MTSTRLPNKIYKQINGAPLLFHVINKAKEAILLDDVLVLSPHPLPDLPENTTQFVYDGSEDDVLGRFYHCFIRHPCEYIVRLTADCPLLDPHIINYVIQMGMGSDYCSNVFEPGFPDGVDVEMISAKTLKWLQANVTLPYHREHVTTYIRNNKEVQKKLNIVSIRSLNDYSGIKISIDTEEELKKAVEMEKVIK